MGRIIDESIYDIYMPSAICHLCGHRGRFKTHCPNCGYEMRLMNSEPCYNCEGTGETPFKTGPGPHEYEFEKCLICNGVGEMSNQKNQWNGTLRGASVVIGHLDGRDAFLRGLDLDECPEGNGIDYRQAWRRAWLQASRDNGIGELPL